MSKRRNEDTSPKEEVVHVHSSSRYSRSPESLRRAIEDYIAAGADVITFTEVAASPREKPLYSFKGWGALTGDLHARNDGGIMWDTTKWVALEEFNHEIATVSWFTTRGHKFPNIAATSVILKSILTGKTMLVSVAHMPPAVQGPTGFLGMPRRLAAYASALEGWRTFWRTQRREKNLDGLMIVADWNLDLRLPWVRAYFNQNFPKFDVVWEGRGEFPDKRTGTTGSGKIIDFTMIKGKLDRLYGPTILPDDDSSDHRPYRETLAL